MTAQPLRVFSARCSNQGAAESHFVTMAASFEEAALAFAERWWGPGDACRIIVTESTSGEQHCFTLDLGEAGA